MKSFIKIYLLSLLIALLILPIAAHAADPIQFTPQISIGSDFVAGTAKTITGTSIADYIIAIYKYAIGIVGILAAIVLMWGGVVWLTAGGSQERVKDAQEWIKASLSGLLIALCSFLILSTVNPDLTKLKSISPQKIEEAPSYTCCKECIGPTCGSVDIISEVKDGKTIYKCPEVSTVCSGGKTCQKQDDGRYRCTDGVYFSSELCSTVGTKNYCNKNENCTWDEKKSECIKSTFAIDCYKIRPEFCENYKNCELASTGAICQKINSAGCCWKDGTGCIQTNQSSCENYILNNSAYSGYTFDSGGTCNGTKCISK
ncbi:MAG: pilin [Patescibacteria group bacterium]|nr:pilin [Patescibacteria group bacterium]MDD4610764.1 pilin [Patescibacteria group bacterium]